MLGFVKKVFFVGLTILSSFSWANSLSCISMKNQECKLRPQVVDVNGNEPMFFPFSIKTNKCSGSCIHMQESVFLILWLIFVIISNVGIKINADVNVNN